jgi:hypothetical protein
MARPTTTDEEKKQERDEGDEEQERQIGQAFSASASEFCRI